MKTGLRALATLAVLFFSSPAPAAEGFAIPRIGFADEVEEPRVNFSIPRYSLTEGERELVAACLILEAASQGDIGLRSVMAVIRNRARGLPELFALTVVREKQFSALNRALAGRESLAHAIERARRDRMWTHAVAIVDEAQRDSWWDPTGGATHYTRVATRTHWTRSLAKTVTIGAHSFYR